MAAHAAHDSVPHARHDRSAVGAPSHGLWRRPHAWLHRCNHPTLPRLLQHTPCELRRVVVHVIRRRRRRLRQRRRVFGAHVGRLSLRPRADLLRAVRAAGPRRRGPWPRRVALVLRTEVLVVTVLRRDRAARRRLDHGLQAVRRLYPGKYVRLRALLQSCRLRTSADSASALEH